MIICCKKFKDIHVPSFELNYDNILPIVNQCKYLGPVITDDIKDLLLLSYPSHKLHTMFSHLRAHAFALSVTVARSSAVQALSSRRQERRWAIVYGSPQSQSTDWASSR